MFATYPTVVTPKKQNGHSFIQSLFAFARFLFTISLILVLRK